MQVGASVFDKAIEERVNAARKASKAEAAHVAAHPGETIKANPKDSRRVTLNGKEYSLREKDGLAYGERPQKHTYVSKGDRDTIEVSRYAKWEHAVDPYQTNYERGRHSTSYEELTPYEDNISSCQKQNPDGSCHYVVKRVKIYRNSGTEVTVKRNIPAGTSAKEQQQNKYPPA